MVTITRSFEFAAAHRLHVPELSEEENRRIFGKCGNPSGHGHNYVLEVTVSGEPDSASGTIVDLPTFEATVQERVIDRFDHKHLNVDCAEFATLNPTVENIARVIWDLLADVLGRCAVPHPEAGCARQRDGAPSPTEWGTQRCRLYAVRVWETPRTFAEYRGE